MLSKLFFYSMKNSNHMYMNYIHAWLYTASEFEMYKTRYLSKTVHTYKDIEISCQRMSSVVFVHVCLSVCCTYLLLWMCVHVFRSLSPWCFLLTLLKICMHTCAHTKGFENVYFIGIMRKTMSCSSKGGRYL